jgi:beta-lactamase class D
MARPLVPAFALLLAACSPATPPAQHPAPAKAGDATVAAAPDAAATGPRELRDLVREFEAERVSGSIALFDTQEGVVGCSDLKRCQEAVVPASTFKIPHSMIALETGVVEGPDTLLPWDGKRYSNDSWHQDLKFRDAFRLSCVPCYMALARKIGEQREREWAEKLDYGNHDVSGGVDKFWLWGGMRISPLQQIDFLRRFEQNKLPISTRTADMVRDIMTLDVTEHYVLLGKTGSTAPPDEARELGWFVGWLEVGERRIFFATLLDGHAEGVDWMAARRRVTERVLRGRGAM